MILERLPEVQKLPSDQKRLLAEELWLSADDPNETTVDPSILDRLNQRLAEYDTDPSAVSSWQKVRERVFRDHAS
jgi:putative addiction module component (TIGR02574 family)